MWIIELLLLFKAENEIQNLNRKVTLLEQDLEAAEDRADTLKGEKATAETECEDSIREAKQLKRSIEILESRLYHNNVAASCYKWLAS